MAPPEGGPADRSETAFGADSNRRGCVPWDLEADAGSAGSVSARSARARSGGRTRRNGSPLAAPSPPAPPGNPDAPATRGEVFAIRVQVDGLRSQVEEGQARLEELRALPGIVEGQQARIAALERGLDAVRSRLARLEDRLANRQAETGRQFAGIEGEFGRVREEITALRTDTRSAIAAAGKAGRKQVRALGKNLRKKTNRKFDAGSGEVPAFEKTMDEGFDVFGGELRALAKRVKAHHRETRAFKKMFNKNFKAMRKEIARLRWLITVELAVAVLILILTR